MSRLEERKPVSAKERKQLVVPREEISQDLDVEFVSESTVSDSQPQAVVASFEECTQKLPEESPKTPIKDRARESIEEPPKEESPTRISRAVDTIVTPAATLAENHQKQHERVRHESAVQSRIAELRKLGLWTAKRLPKLQEPPRPETHWDIMLKEAKWLQCDYKEERKWKRNAARRIAYAAYRFVNNKKNQEERIKKEKLQYIKKIAASLSKEVRSFWSSVEKIVDFKQQTKLEETRKRAYGLHLSYILDQTSKFSNDMLDEQSQQPPQTQQLATNQNESNYLNNEDGDGDTDMKKPVINVSMTLQLLFERLYRATLVSKITSGCQFLDEPKLLT